MGYCRFQIGCVFAEHDPFKPTVLYKFYIYRFSNKFYTVLYQFPETKIPDRTIMGLNQLLKYLDFSLNPLSFLIYSSFDHVK